MSSCVGLEVEIRKLLPLGQVFDDFAILDFLQLRDFYSLRFLSVRVGVLVNLAVGICRRTQFSLLLVGGERITDRVWFIDFKFVLKLSLQLFLLFKLNVSHSAKLFLFVFELL